VRRELNRDADALANVALDQAPGNRTEIRKESPGAARSASPDAVTTPKSATPRRIRARFERGVLIPAEPLDLPDGTEVVVEIFK
jgi:hypothetical protein